MNLVDKQRPKCFLFGFQIKENVVAGFALLGLLFDSRFDDVARFIS